MFERPDGRPAANPLGLSLGFFEGEAFVTLRERTVAKGVIIRALDLALTDVALPAELDGGDAEAFQRRSTRLRGLVLDVNLELIHAALVSGFIDTPYSELRIAADDEHLVFEADVAVDGHRGTLVTQLTLGRGPHRSLRGYFTPPAAVGFVPMVPRLLVADLIEAGRKALGRLSPQSARSLKRVGGGGISLDPVDALMWAVMPVNGWKVPEHEDIPLRGVSVTSTGFLRIVVGDVRELDAALLPDAAVQTQLEARVTSALVREESAGLAALQDDDLLDGRGEAVFRNLAAALAPDQEALAAVVLGLGSAHPSLHSELVDLADRLGRENPRVAARAGLALASVEALEGRDERARQHLVDAARSFRAAGQRRLPGLVLRAAAEGAPAEDRARLLEETIAVRADDVQALTGLVEVLPTLGRAPAAVRAARRLAHLSPEPAERLRAHLTAGALLRDEVGDFAQARRELDRALKLVPNHPEALEGLARTSAAEGDRTGANEIFLGLIGRADAESRPQEAARLLLATGDLWLDEDPQAALEHYRRAHQIVPDRVGPVAAMAKAAALTEDIDLERSVVAQARDRLSDAEGTEPGAVFALRRAMARHAVETSGDTDEAVAQLKAALRLTPDHIETLEALGRLHALREEHAEHAHVLGLQAERAVLDHRWEDAARLLTTQVAAIGDDVQARRSIRPRVASALSAFSDADAGRLSSAEDGHRALLDVFVDVSMSPEERLDALDRRMVLDDPPPVQAALWLSFARALEDAGRTSDAARAYEESLATQHAPDEAMQALLRIYRERDDPERLALVLAKVAALAPTPEAKAEALTNRAVMLTRIGRDLDAYASVTGALETEAAPSAARRLATKLALRLERFDEARGHVDARLEQLDAESGELSTFLDLADVADKQSDVDGLILGLSEARKRVDPASIEGRQLASRLAQVLERADRIDALAELERERGRVGTAPAGERAERLLASARLSLRLGLDEQAASDAEEALALLGSGTADAALRTAALEVQERIAERLGDPAVLAGVLGQRAALTLDPDEQAELRLEQAEVLEAAGRSDAAVDVLAEALRHLPDALVLAERLGYIADRAGRSADAAPAFARAAELAEGRDASTVELHGRAAAAYVRAGRADEAVLHDRAVLKGTAVGDRNPWFDASAARLETSARAGDDSALLAEVLGRRAADAPPESAARLLLEKARLEADVLDQSRSALDALRRAQTLAPEGSGISAAATSQLAALLEALGHHSERAALFAERAGRVDASDEKAALLLKAAEVHADRMDDPATALSFVDSALKQQPDDEDARRFRLELLRKLDRNNALADALIEEASRQTGPGQATERLMEAALLIAPLESLDVADIDIDRGAVERAWAVMRRALEASSGDRKRSVEALETSVAYAHALGHLPDELEILSELTVAANDPKRRAQAHLRRAMLLDTRVQEVQAALRALFAAYDELKRLPSSAASEVARDMPDGIREWLETERQTDPALAALSKALVLSRRAERWDDHLRVLEGLIHRSTDSGLMSELYARAGVVFQEQRLDASAAESAYRSAILLSPEHQRAKEKLHALLVDGERFGDLGDALGLDALLEVQSALEPRLPKGPRRRLLTAVSERLPKDGPDWAPTSVRLARLELDDPETASIGVSRLRRLVDAEVLADEALDLLGEHFDRSLDDDGVCSVLRQKAARSSGIYRAEALTALADALEHRLGDPHAAEFELRAALDVDASYEPARQRFCARCLADDRFEDLAAVLGPEALTEPMRALMGEGPGALDRAFRAAAAWVGAHPGDQQTDLWLDTAEAFDALAHDDRLLGLLQQQSELVSGPEERIGLLLAFAERALAKGDDNRRSEDALKSVLTLDPAQQDARSHLLRLYETHGRYFDIGRVLGAPLLEDIRARAEAHADSLVLRKATEALAQLTDGEQRADLLMSLAAETAKDPNGREQVEGLYRSALTADPGNMHAREALRVLLGEQGRFRDIGARLGIPALRQTLDEVETGGPREQVLPALLGLIDVVRDVPDAADECTDLWVKAAGIHQEEVDFDSAEYSLRMALANHPDHERARLMLRRLLISQDRLAELANVDPTLLAEAISAAKDSGEVDLQVRGLRVLAERTTGPERANLLAQVAEHELARDRTQAAEADLQSALKADPDHEVARNLLADVSWSEGRFAQVARVLGPDAFIDRARQIRTDDPRRASVALRTAAEDLPEGARARAYELLAMIVDEDADIDADRRRRVEDLRKAEQLSASVDDQEGVQRALVSVVSTLRDSDDFRARLNSVVAALERARGGSKSALMLEQVALREALGENARAMVVARRLLADESLPEADRDEAARMLVDRLDAEGNVRTAALERLVEARLGGPAEHSRWRQALADIREADGAEAEAVIVLLEAALVDVSTPEDELELRRRLLALHDELGDWRQAESHAAALAMAEGTPEQWVALSELRMWLDDRQGAKAALENAIRRSPGSRPANESLVRLAEQEGATASVMARLEAWAEADVDGRPADRAERLLHAARLAVDEQHHDKAAHLAERALTLVPRRDPSMEDVARRAVDVLEPLGLAEAQARILSTALAAVAPGSGSGLRLSLSALLKTLDRQDEAATVIEQGLHREIGDDDPLVERYILDVRSLDPQLGAKRMLAAAERLGSGPVGRRLRVVGAELAEAGGDKETALTAWSRIGRDVGAAGDGARARAARVRISRDLDDAAALLDALIEAAEDADNDAERVSRLAEAAELAEVRLDAPERAEQLLRRAIQLAEDPSILQDTLFDLLRRHERWSSLDAELARLADAEGGPVKAGLYVQRAEILRTHLHDDIGAATLYALAYEADPAPDRGADAAAALERAGDLEAAEALLDTMMQQLPSGSHAWLRVALSKADALERAGQVDASVETFRRIADAVPDAALVGVRLQQVLLRHRRWPELAELLLTDARYDRPIDRIRNRLAAARLLLTQAHAPDRAVAALRSVLRIVQGWLADPQLEMPDLVVPVPETSGAPSVEMTLDSPLLDLARLAEELGQSRLRVDALRLYAQSLPAGTAQQRALLLLAAAERESGDLDAAEFTLRNAVEAIHAAPNVDFVDRVEADRALGMLLLDRDAAEDAVEVLSRAESMLQGRGQAGDSARAQILVKLAQAYRGANRPRDAVGALQEARLLDERELPYGLLEEAVEAAGPSEALAELLEKRAAARSDPTERALMLRDAARVWEQLGRSERALSPLSAAYEQDATDKAEAVRLQELLYQSERWGALEQHMARRLEAETLDDTERVTLLLARAQLVEDRDESLSLLEEAFDRQPSSVDVLDALAAQAAARGRLDQQQDMLARLAAATTDPQRVLRALLDRVAILERMDDLPQATAVLEEALERALRLPAYSPRAIIDHLSRLYASRDDRAAEARLWVRAAAETEGAQAAAYLARAADLRRDALADRRGALAAIEAAIRANPEDLSLRWSAVQLATSLGDDSNALAHAEEAAQRAEKAGFADAHRAFLKEMARRCDRLGERDKELAAWTTAIGTATLDAATLDEIVHRAQAEDGPSAAQLERALVNVLESLEPGRIRGEYRLARARLLERPLHQHSEAAILRSEASTQDGVEDTPLKTESTDEGPDPGARAQLERTGRWGEFAAAESARAATHSSRPERVRVLVTAGKRILDADQPDLSRARSLFDEAIRVCPDSMAAWSARARLDLRSGDVDGAMDALQRLRALGGAPWAPPQLELAIARVAMSRGDRPAAMTAFARARLQDPSHREPAAGLARLAERLPGRSGVRRWFDDYRALLDETLDATALAQLCYAEALQAKEAGDTARSLQRVGRALKLRPEHAQARQLRLDVLKELGDSPFLLDALTGEAIEALEPADARQLQSQAFELARRLGDRRRGLALATTLEDRAGDDPELQMSLYAFYRDHGDHEGLLRMADSIGGIEALGPLPREQRVAIAAACFASGRPVDAFTLLIEALPPSWTPQSPRDDIEAFVDDLAAAFGVISLAEPSDQIRLRAVLADLPEHALSSPSVMKALEVLSAWQPGARATRRLLAASYRLSSVNSRDVVDLYRGLLAEDPGDVHLLEALAELLPEQAGLGAQAIVSWIDNESAVRHPWPTARPADAAFFDRLRTSSASGPLGTLLRVSASALAGVLPPSDAPAGARRPAHEDPRVADVAQTVRAVVQVPLTVVVDGEGGRSVRMEPGDPSTLVIGEALANDATPDELRFHLARAAMLVELGFLVVQRCQGTERRHYVTLAASVVDPRHREAVPAEYLAGADLLRSRLDPSARAAAEAAVAELSLDDLPLAVWLRGAMQTADRFGAMMAGAPGAALTALHRADPRTLVEPMATREDRVRAIRRWRPLRDLVAFVVSDAYVDLIDGVAELPAVGRF